MSSRRPLHSSAGPPGHDLTAAMSLVEAQTSAVEAALRRAPAPRAPLVCPAAHGRWPLREAAAGAAPPAVPAALPDTRPAAGVPAPDSATGARRGARSGGRLRSTAAEDAAGLLVAVDSQRGEGLM